MKKVGRLLLRIECQMQTSKFGDDSESGPPIFQPSFNKHWFGQESSMNAKFK